MGLAHEKIGKIIRGGSFFGVVLGFIMYTNYYMDSLCVIRSSYDEIGKMLNSGYNVMGLAESRYDDRKLLMSYIETNPNTIDNIIIGSSRSRLFRSGQICEGSFRNYGLSGGCLNDYYNVIGYLEYQKQMPKKVILEVNGSLFFKQDSREVYMHAGKIYLQSVIQGNAGELEYPGGRGRDYRKLFDLDYFKSNLEDYRFGRSRFLVDYTLQDANDMGTKLSDGCTLENKEYRERPLESIIRATEQAVENHSVYKVNGFTKLNSNYVEEFEVLVNFLQEMGVQVELYLPPYTEPIYSMMRENKQEYGGVFETEEYIEEFCRKNNIALYGSFNPEYCGLKLNEMYDAVHIKAEYMSKTYFKREL